MDLFWDTKHTPDPHGEILQWIHTPQFYYRNDITIFDLCAADARATYVQDANHGKAADALPLLANVFLVADDDDVLEFFVVEVAGAQRHDEAA